MLRISTTLLVLACATSVAKEEESKSIELSLNQTELQKALDKVEGKKKKSLNFLIENMPEQDLKELKADFLLENLHLAYKARAQFPWAKKLDDKIFDNDVLPYASLNEKREAWRADFYKRFAPIVKDAKTAEEAVKAISNVIKKKLGVKYSTKRKKPHQSPSESMELGLASCTGLSILLVDACRSVGIPARIVGTPAWTTKRGNHNWVEIYTPSDKKWHFTEYYADPKGLDRAWFAKDAYQANKNSKYHSIYASSWKKTGTHFPLVWNMNVHNVPAVNVTQNYNSLAPKEAAKKNLCELRIAFYDHQNKRKAIAITVSQGGATVTAGVSPKVTDDMNKFFNVNIQKGQLYNISWLDPESQEQKHKKIHAPKNKNTFTVNLK